ncbi:MAG: hypothetical protein ACETWE_09225 [Candidatus Bathyarchaeia archaeon]
MTTTLRGLDNILDGLSLRLIEQRKKIDGWKNQVSNMYKEYVKSLDEKKRELQKELSNDLPNLLGKLRDDVDYRIQTQRRRMEDKLKNFENDIEDLEKQRDIIHVELTKETETVRKLNPELDREEETLKEEKTKLVGEENTLRLEVRKLSPGFLGRWRNRERIGELEYQMRNLQPEIDGVSKRIDDIRKMWQEKKEEWRRKKVTAEQKWNEITLRIAEIRHEYLYNKTNQETIVAEEGIRTFVEELMVGKYVKAEDYSDEVIKIYYAQISSLLEQKKTLESTLETFTKVTGRLIGIDRGIKRLRKSIDALKAEQDRYASLRELRIEVPRTILQLEKSLETLEAIPGKTLEELKDVTKVLGPFADEDKGELSNENIKRFFDSIGENLQAAVQRYWR